VGGGGGVRKWVGMLFGDVEGEELGSGLGCFLGTWRGRLTLSAAWNESWHGKEEVEGFLESCVGVMMGWVDGLEKRRAG